MRTCAVSRSSSTPRNAPFLGFLVSERGIECNPVKIKAIERMVIPTKLRDVQKFTGCLASLNRFISRLGEKALPPTDS